MGSRVMRAASSEQRILVGCAVSEDEQLDSFLPETRDGRLLVVDKERGRQHQRGQCEIRIETKGVCASV